MSVWTVFPWRVFFVELASLWSVFVQRSPPGRYIFIIVGAVCFLPQASVLPDRACDDGDDTVSYAGNL